LSKVDPQTLLEELAAFETAISLRPNYPRAWQGRGIVLAELGRLDESLASFNEAIRLKPDFAEAWYGKAIILRRLQKATSTPSNQAAQFLAPPGQSSASSHGNQVLHEGDRQPRVGNANSFHSEDMLDSNPFNLLEDGESMVVDGANLIRHVGCEPHNGRPCSNPGRMWILLELLEQRAAWEQKSAENAMSFIVIDASLRHHVDDQAKLEWLIKKEAVIQMPPGHPSDQLILELADETEAAVLSNDWKMRKDFAARYPWVRDEHRFLKYVLVSEKLRKIRYLRRPRRHSATPDSHATHPRDAHASPPLASALPQLDNTQTRTAGEDLNRRSRAQLRQRVSEILHQLGLSPMRDATQPTPHVVTCGKCGARIDLSNPRVRFCYRCRAPVLLH